MPNHPTYFMLINACEQPGCPVCRLEQQAVERYLSHLFYESVNDSATRAHLRASLGFCREHADLLLASGLGDALGMSIIYHDVFGTLLKRLGGKKVDSSEGDLLSRTFGRAAADSSSRLERLRQIISPHESCLACQQRESTMRMTLSVLIDSIQDQEMRAAFMRSEGLCLPHLRQACKQAQDSSALTELLNIELKKLETLHSELAEFIRKNDYRFMKEEIGSEGNAWRRAARLAAGGRGET